MKFIHALTAGFLLAAGLSAAAQEDKEALKRDILKRVEERLKSEEDRLLKDIEKLLDEELKGGAPRPAPAPAPAPRKARGYMGVRPGDLTDEEKDKLGIKSGIKVVEVPEGGPADKAGLKVGDVITSIDGKAVDSPQEVPTIVQNAGAGTKLKVDLLREGKKQTLEVTLGRHPLDPPEADPKSEAPKKEEPKEGDLRERVKKFLQKEEPKAEAPKPAPKKPAEPADPGDDLFAFDEQMFEQFRGVFEQFGMDPEQFFEKGKDDKYRLNDQWKQLFKGLELDKLFGRKPAEDPAPEPAPRAAPKAEPKPSGPRPWIGLQPEELSAELRSQLDIPDGVGLLVGDVVDGGPAMKAGLKKNDILVKIDGKDVKGEESLAAFMKSAKAGQEATLTVIRKAKEQTLKVTVGEKKD
jgi:membrane-associated protease RseP (regulator of RpoE activity)